jgi:hypothetical protein
MADPNASPVGSSVGTLTAPNESQLTADISALEDQYEPRVQAEEATAQKYEAQSVSAEEQASTYAEESASSMSAADEEMTQWANSTPTRQASYATSMHAAPILSVLTALGGKLTKLNGQQMLAATTGIVQGLNESSEQKYQAAMDAWKASFEKMRLHQQRLMDLHRLMLTTYKGRADAYQKAAESARRMTGDILDDKQRQIAQKIDTFKAQSAAWGKLQQINVARDALHERTLQHIRQEDHWKKLEADSGKMPAEIKAQLAAAKSRWQNAKAQEDENLRKRGQISGNLNLPDEQKAPLLARIDDEDEALKAEMNRATSDADAITAGFTASRQAGGGSTPGATPPAPAAKPNPRAGAIDRSGGAAPPKPQADVQLSPKRMQILQQNKGQPVKWADGEYIMDADGTVRRVQ